MTKQTLSAFQAITMSSSSYFPVLFWIYPQIAVHYALFDAQWAVILVALIGICTNWLHGALNERFPTMTGADPVQYLFGKWIGKITLCLYVPVYILFLSLSTYFMTQLMKYFLPHTSKYLLAACVILVGWRGAMCGVETLGRASSIIHPLTLTGLVTTFAIILYQSESKIIPLTITHPMNIANATYHLFPLYMGVDLVLIISPYYQHVRGKSIWYPVYGALVGGFIIVIVFFSIIVNINWIPAERLSFPVQVVIQLIRIHGFLIERLGITIIILSVAFLAVFTANQIWALSVTIARLFNRSDHAFKPFTFFVTPVTYIISVSLHNGSQARILVEQVLTPASWILLLAIPLLKLVVSSVFQIRSDDRGKQRGFSAASRSRTRVRRTRKSPT